MFQYDQTNVQKYVKLCKMTLIISGIQDEKEIVKTIHDSFDETSLNKLKALGLKEGEYALYDLEKALNGSCQIPIEEEFLLPQKSEETLQQYLKRLKMLLPQMGDDLPTVGEFLNIFENGIHPNLLDSTKNLIIEKIKRLPRNSLHETIEILDGALTVIANSSKERILKPRKTCYCCKSKFLKAPVDLEGVEEACDD